MTEERFSIAAARHEAVVLVVSIGCFTEVNRGIATWKTTNQPGTNQRQAAVRTPDGEIHTGSSPSESCIFTEAGMTVGRAVVYQNRKETVRALNSLGNISDELLVDTLFDEVEAYQFKDSLLDLLNGLAEQRPAITTHRRVIQARKARATEQANLEAELRMKLDAMTQVATGHSTPEEADAIKLRVLENASVLRDGTALTIRTTEFGELPRLKNRDSLKALEKLAVPLGNGRHMTARKGIHVNYQQLPSPNDTGGLILAMTGRVLNSKEAGKHNRRIIQSSRAAARAKAELSDRLDLWIPASEGIPTGAQEVVAARAGSDRGYRSRYYTTSDGRLIHSRTDDDGARTLRATAPNTSATTIAKGLGIKESDLPRLERHATKTAAHDRHTRGMAPPPKQ